MIIIKPDSANATFLDRPFVPARQPGEAVPHADRNRAPERAGAAACAARAFKGKTAE